MVSTAKAQRAEIPAQPLVTYKDVRVIFGRFVLGKLHHLLLRSMVSNGSTNTVWPVALAACTTPSPAASRPRARDDEAVVAQRDVVFACLAATRPQNALERFLNCFARAAPSGANALQLGRGIVADFAVWQHARR